LKNPSKQKKGGKDKKSLRVEKECGKLYMKNKRNREKL